jgi:hypothetical protein
LPCIIIHICWICRLDFMIKLRTSRWELSASRFTLKRWNDPTYSCNMDQEPGRQPITSWHGPRWESSLSLWGTLDLNSMFIVLSSFIGLGVNGYARCLSHIFIHVDGAMTKNVAQATIYQSKKMNTTHHS